MFYLRKYFVCFWILCTLPCFSQKQKPSLILLSDDVLSQETTGQSNQTIGYLGMNQDVFLRTAAFSWGLARFSIKGYDYTQRHIFLNGILTNDLDTGMPSWSTWSGLNDVFRQIQLSKGLTPFAVGIGALGIATQMDTNPFLQRLGTRISYMASNASYQARLMATHAGTLKGNWRYVYSASKRYGKSGFVKGNFYDAHSSFFSLGKQFSNHLIYLTAIGAYKKQGRSSPYTQEVFALKGSAYNPNWGLQNGRLRNAKYRKVFKPLFMLTHTFEIPTFQMQTTLSYQFGNRYDTRLGYQKTTSPDPAYYQKMPSYLLRFGNVAGKAKAYDAEKNFKKHGQLRWEDFYQINKINKQSLYYLYADEQQDQKWDLHTSLQFRFAKKWDISVALLGTSLQRTYFGKIHDLLGGNFITNADAYQKGDTRYYDLKNAGDKLKKGDTFQYHYNLGVSKINLFVKQNYYSKHWDFYTALAIEQVAAQREGFFQNGKFPYHSLGVAPTQKFMGFSFKAGGTFRPTNRHLFSLHTAFLRTPPLLSQMYINPREHFKTFENKKLPTQYAVELSYHYRGNLIKGALTGFYTLFENGIQKQFTYVSGLSNYENDFSVQHLKNIKKIHMGLEGFLTTKINDTFEITFTGAWGAYHYANAPDLYLYNEKGRHDLGSAFLKGVRVASTPQGAVGLDFSYRSPQYWWVGFNINGIFDRYLTIAPLLRTASFWKDTDGIPFRDAQTQKYIHKKQVSKLLTQERLSDIFLCNAVGGKSWKINRHYLSLFFSINNLLGTVYKTGGFEQNRNANYQDFLEDKKRTLPIFGNKYWYGKGTTYYLMFSWSF